MSHLTGKLTKRIIDSLPAGRHGDGNGLFLVVDPSGARRWVLRVTVKGQRNAKGAPLRTDFGLGGANVTPLHVARERALKYRMMAKQGINPKYSAVGAIPTFEEVARQVHMERLPTWRNKKHGDQFINTLRDYAFPKIGRRLVSEIGQPEILSCLSPIWTEKHETAKRVAQRLKVVLDVAKSKGWRTGENPVTAIKDARVLPKVKVKVKHHMAMPWQDVPAFYADLQNRSAMSAKALMFTCLTGSRTGEVLGARWEEFDFQSGVWNVPEERMKTEVLHRVPLTPAMLEIIEPLKALQSEYVFEGQKRNKPLSNMAMLMLLRRMGVEGVTVHGFRSTFRVWASEIAFAPRELTEMSLAREMAELSLAHKAPKKNHGYDVAEMSLALKVGSTVERSYADSDLIDRRRALLERWAGYVTGESGNVVRIGRG